MKVIFTVFLLIMSCVFTVSANATFVDNGNGTITDTDTGLMWLQNANVNGMMNWFEAMEWADNLIYAGYADWRLPTIGTTGPGYDVVDSELGHLYYTELGGVSYSPPTDWSPFTNIQSNNGISAYYWLNLMSNPINAWYFDVLDGKEGNTGDAYDGYYYALAVRGVSTVPPVPEPSTLLLLGAGIAGVAVCRRKSGR